MCAYIQKFTIMIDGVLHTSHHVVQQRCDASHHDLQLFQSCTPLLLSAIAWTGSGTLKCPPRGGLSRCHGCCSILTLTAHTRHFSISLTSAFQASGGL